MSIQVVIADDHALVRAGFRALIAAEPGFSVAGEAATGRQAIEMARQTDPDIVLMDIRMPELDGIEATRQIVGSPAAPAARVLILTTFDLDEYVYAALRAGASGFLTKDTPPAELISAIRVISAGDALLSPQITRRLIETFLTAADIAPAARPPDEALAAITDREREVLALVGHGLSNTEIARQLKISPNTTRTHVGHLLTKLEARDRVHLVVLAYKTGLITLRWPTRPRLSPSVAVTVTVEVPVAVGVPEISPVPELSGWAGGRPGWRRLRSSVLRP